MTKRDELTEYEELWFTASEAGAETIRAGAEAIFATGKYSECWSFDYDRREAYYITDEGTKVITFAEACEWPDDPQKGLVRFFMEKG